MSTLTIRIDEALKSKAAKKAKKLGLSLSLIIKNALRDFVKKPKVVISEVEEVENVPPHIQEKMDQIFELLDKKRAQKK